MFSCKKVELHHTFKCKKLNQLAYLNAAADVVLRFDMHALLLTGLLQHINAIRFRRK